MIRVDEYHINDVFMITTVTFLCYTCSRLYDLGRLTADFKPDSPTHPQPRHAFNISKYLRKLCINHCSADSRVQQPHV